MICLLGDPELLYHFALDSGNETLIFAAGPELLNFRVEPAVADWLPHSPVRAQLRHTVLQARISLRRWSGQPLGAVAGKTA